MFGYMPEFKDHYFNLLKFTNYDLLNRNDSLDFVYEKDNKELSYIRNKYELTKVAGDNSDISKVLNIMSWLHEKVKHDNVAPPKMCNPTENV